MKKLLLTLSVIFMTLCANASVAGLWQTIDDETGNPKSVVRVYESEGLFFGEILFTYNEQGVPNTKKDAAGRSACDTALKAANMEGAPSYCNLIIIKNMKPAKNDKLEGGTITDPKKGKTYKAEMWLDGENLIVRGKIAFLGRNQTWRPFTTANLAEVITP